MFYNIERNVVAVLYRYLFNKSNLNMMFHAYKYKMTPIVDLQWILKLQQESPRWKCINVKLVQNLKGCQ